MDDLRQGRLGIAIGKVALGERGWPLPDRRHLQRRREPGADGAGHLLLGDALRMNQRTDGQARPAYQGIGDRRDELIAPARRGASAFRQNVSTQGRISTSSDQALRGWRSTSI